MNNYNTLSRHRERTRWATQAHIKRGRLVVAELAGVADAMVDAQRVDGPTAAETLIAALTGDDHLLDRGRVLCVALGLLTLEVTPHQPASGSVEEAWPTANVLSRFAGAIGVGYELVRRCRRLALDADDDDLDQPS
jgi:hypothetical protein